MNYFAYEEISHGESPDHLIFPTRRPLLTSNLRTNNNNSPKTDQGLLRVLKSTIQGKTYANLCLPRYSLIYYCELRPLIVRFSPLDWSDLLLKIHIPGAGRRTCYPHGNSTSFISPWTC